MIEDKLKDSVIRLTSLSKSSGCGCKIAPDVLEKILANTRTGNDFSKLLIGNQFNDDAAVYDLDNNLGLIATTDFFTPIVDDPFHFGQIAAANALSDVYAMGGKPILAMAILGWPIDSLPAEMASEVMKGATNITSEIGIPIAGGHSVDTREPLFGLSVNGLVTKQNIKPISAAQEGDWIFMTKPLGNGILGTAFKRDLLDLQSYEIWLKNMTSLNKIGFELGGLSYVNAMTDITGFGLIGHLGEMAEASALSVEINFSDCPVLKQALPFISSFCFPDNTYRNWNAWEKKTTALSPAAFIPLNDPQTSGGLLFTVQKDKKEETIDFLNKNGLSAHTTPVGRFTKSQEKVLNIQEA